MWFSFYEFRNSGSFGETVLLFFVFLIILLFIRYKYVYLKLIPIRSNSLQQAHRHTIY